MISKLKQKYHWLNALMANCYYGFPSRKLIVIGVTGTDGKTTTSSLIHYILTEAGKKAGLISTVNAKIGDKQLPMGLHVTTPKPWELQSLIKKMVVQKCEYLVLEASSHGLEQYRLFGVNFYTGVVTNVTHDHLDYHKTYANYLKAKSKLFEHIKFAILNKDDQSFEFLHLKAQKAKAKILTYGLKPETDFNLQNFKFTTHLPGEYNQYNCLAAAAATTSVGIEEALIKKGLTTFKGVIGRMEDISLGQKFRVVVDFASTPNSLENILKTLKSQLKTGGQLIAVFGSAGLRDIQKRPMMGKIAGDLADVTVLTAEDPRTEDVNNIIKQIETGFKKTKSNELYKEPDRHKAINLAIGKIAKEGDIVALLGKAHEKSMCFGKTEYPWDERSEASKAIKKRLKK